jgi:hypothetical protein
MPCVRSPPLLAAASGLAAAAAATSALKQRGSSGLRAGAGIVQRATTINEEEGRERFGHLDSFLLVQARPAEAPEAARRGLRCGAAAHATRTALRRKPAILAAPTSSACTQRQSATSRHAPRVLHDDSS